MSTMYKFDQDDVVRFIHSMGAKAMHKNGQYVFKFCPYCNGGGGKDRDTFYISASTGQFECKRSSCGAKGNMITLSRDFNFSLGRDVDAYYRSVDYSSKQYRKFKSKHIESKDAAVQYMSSRGISEEVTRAYEITATEKDGILAFPFRDESGELTFIKYRNTKYIKGETNGSKEYCETNCKPILFGMAQCDTSNKTLVITEGQMDSLSLAEAGIQNAVSVPTGANGFTWVPHCWDFMNKFEKIICFGDCENGQVTLSEQLSKRWPLKVRTVRQEDYLGCKDANEILQKHGKEALIRAVENAPAPEISGIKLLKDVRHVDIMKFPIIKTHMTEVDKILDGGFRLGQLAVLTGRRGNGKSTMASMIGVEAMAQGYNCFFYSGELPDYFFKDWMDNQVTKKRELKQSEQDQLNMWYGDKAYIYDNAAFDDEKLDLLEAIKIAIIQKECKFILIDNLMTSLDGYDLSVDLYTKQASFVASLAKLAKTYEVFILLVSHPKKTVGNLTNDDISGTSQITDRADIVLSYDRIPDGNDPTLRRLQVLKNRLTGKLAEGEKAIQLEYDEHSKRVGDGYQSFAHHNFDWNKSDPYGFEDAEELTIPF